PVEPPKETLQYMQYFCTSNSDDMQQLKTNEAKRVELYKSVASLARAYGQLANDMTGASYSHAQAEAIKTEVAHYVAVRTEIKLCANEDLDFKAYEAGMRHILDTYISAEPSQ